MGGCCGRGCSSLAWVRELARAVAMIAVHRAPGMGGAGHGAGEGTRAGDAGVTIKWHKEVARQVAATSANLARGGGDARTKGGTAL